MHTQHFRPLRPFLFRNSTSGRTDRQTHRSTYKGGAHLNMYDYPQIWLKMLYQNVHAYALGIKSVLCFKNAFKIKYCSFSHTKNTKL